MKFKVGRQNNVIPDGIYQAIVTDIKERHTFKRPALFFTFEIADGPHSGVQAYGFCNASYKTYTSRTKLYAWYEAATGDSLDADDDLDTDDFLNRVLKVRIERKTAKKTKNEFSNVTAILDLVREL